LYSRSRAQNPGYLKCDRYIQQALIRVAAIAKPMTPRPGGFKNDLSLTRDSFPITDKVGDFLIKFCPPTMK
ncbi:hypothetical protein QUA40_27190, partial [Microcoleus sp. Pol11C3]|uniref:hypothetical protein n=1 Tax=Microcoleus sp. Pol11C3 TaxID=3055390 RepID=UPI002FCFAB41